MALKAKTANRKQIDSRYAVSQTKAKLHSMEALMETQNMASAFYAGLDPRRRQEMSDGGMVQEDPDGMANLSEKFIHKEYPRVGYYNNPYIDDQSFGEDL